MVARKFTGQFVNYMKLNNTTNWAELNTTRLLTPKGNCVKKNFVSCSPRIQNGLYICCLHELCCISGLPSQEEALHLLQRLDPSWKHWPSSGRCSSARREPALSSCTDVGSGLGSPTAEEDGPLSSHTVSSVSSGHWDAHWKCQQIPIFSSWASRFPFPDNSASLILAEMCPGACSEANEFYILTLQEYVLFEGICNVCNMDNILWWILRN